MKKVIARAPGKCILFGEHSVVFGYPAIAMGIDLGSTCEILQTNDNKITFYLESYNKTYEYSNIEDLISSLPDQFEQFGYCFKRFKESYNVEFNNIKITLSFSFHLTNMGLGSSASTAVSLVYAIKEFYDLQLNKQKISHFALDMEKVVHGTPSGIDNTVCTFGSMILYEQGAFRFMNINNAQNLKLLITYSNLKHNTGEAVKKFREYTKLNPDDSDVLLGKMGIIARRAENELQKMDLKEIGDLMNKNQELLTTFGVSNDTISKITGIALKNGALGSKLTGAGLGGCVISLCTLSNIDKIADVLEVEGYRSWITGIDNSGVRIVESKSK